MALVIVERRSRYMFAVVLASKDSKELLKAMMTALQPYDCKTMVMDHGGQFALCPLLQEMTITSYFCDPGNPNDQGLVENPIGCL